MVQGSYREAEAAAATGASLQRRSEEAHRAALMAEADADLAHGEEGAAAREAERSAAANKLIHLTMDVMQVWLHQLLPCIPNNYLLADWSCALHGPSLPVSAFGSVCHNCCVV